jgi:hypothetical protein
MVLLGLELFLARADIFFYRPFSLLFGGLILSREIHGKRTAPG